MTTTTRPYRVGALPMLSIALASCGALPSAPAETETAASAITSPDQRVTTCKQDQRVLAGLVSAEICAGADIFFRETFAGNGRTCGSCHPAGHNFTIDRTFINNLFALHPDDPLFVFRNDTNLVGLEREEF